MDKRPGGCAIQIIDGDGQMSVTELQSFCKKFKLECCGLSHIIVSIMGPQSSGKSTLMNNLFGTSFKVMDALEGRSQTTRGIWLSKAVGIVPPTFVMDLEGTDGAERGEDDTTFERQSALFALAVSDIVLINMWCHDIGRERAANKPLLKTVFQAMMRILSPRKITLMFVIRDITKTPLERLESMLKEDIKKIWDSVSKPPEHKDSPVTEFFNIEVVSLSSYEHMEEQFMREVSRLRRQFFYANKPGGLVGDQRPLVPASGFIFSCNNIWKLIQEDKDLDQPAHGIMVAVYRCEEIASQMYSAFTKDKEIREIQEAAGAQPVPGFGKKLREIIATYTARYKSKAKYFDEGVRVRKGKELEERLLQLVRPAFQLVLEDTRSRTLESFRKVFHKALSGGGEEFQLTSVHCTQLYMDLFDEECRDFNIEEANWDTYKTKEALQRDMEAHIAAVREAKIIELSKQNEEMLKYSIYKSLEIFFGKANDETWPGIREILQQETKLVVSGYSHHLSGFVLDDKTTEKLISCLRAYSRDVVEMIARREAGSVQINMTKRFREILNQGSDSMPRVWTGKEDIRAIISNGYRDAIKMLSVMAVICLDLETENDTDNIFETLYPALLITEAANESSTLEDPLSSSTWDEIPSSRTLITPVECRILWNQFISETEDSIIEAKATRKAAKGKRVKRNLMKVGQVAASTTVAVALTTIGVGSSNVSSLFGS